MEGAKTKIILTALVISVIVIASIGYYLIKDAGVEGITTMEGKVQADEIALNWNSSAELVDVGLMTSIGGNNDGKATAWGYSYICKNSSLGFAVTIFSNGSNISSELEPPSFSPILDWTIDSNEAFEIAKSNPDIKTWLHKYINADIQSVRLSANETSSAWGIAWFDAGFMDDPHTAAIVLDATTGEIIDLYIQQ